ncbi:MAG: ATP phosphoribosyltransferase [Pseudomonadota bacterium]
MSNDQGRLRIAVQKSGRLLEESIELLRLCGIQLLKSKDQLFCKAENFPLDVYFVRDDDIPAFVSSNVCDIGIVGQNVLYEEQLSQQNSDIQSIEEVLPLGFGKCRLSMAAPYSFEYKSSQSLDKQSIATSYPGLVRKFLDDNNVQAKIIEMSGSVEIAPRIQMTDVICDLVSTGGTLATNGLTEVETILESQAVLIKNGSLSSEKQPLLDQLLLRIQGVQEAKSSKYIMLHAPNEKVDDIKGVLPGAESPTILSIQGRNDMVAIHAVCNEGVFWDTMENLKAKGASSILVLPIEKMME